MTSRSTGRCDWCLLVILDHKKARFNKDRSQSYCSEACRQEAVKRFPEAAKK